MKLLAILLATLLLACTATEQITGTEKGTNTQKNIITYAITGTAYSVDVAFCSQMGPRDTIPGVILPFYATFELPVGETAFMRVHAKDHDDVISVGIVQNGFYNAVDTAIQGDPMAEVNCEVVEGF